MPKMKDKYIKQYPLNIFKLTLDLPTSSVAALTSLISAMIRLLSFSTLKSFIKKMFIQIVLLGFHVGELVNLPGHFRNAVCLLFLHAYY